MIFLNPIYIYDKLYGWIVDLFTFSVVTIFMVKVVWFTAGVLFLFLAIIFHNKKAALRKAEQEARKEAVHQAQTTSVAKEDVVWNKIMGNLNSTNPSDWKLAILEADTILDSIIQKMGYRGDNLGERLKSIEPSDFDTLNDAWEAHKIRNTIAHEAGYELTQREAKRVLKLFENVFREFDYL